MSSTPAAASTTAALVAHHRRVVRRRWLIIAALFTLAVLAFVVSTMVGAITIPFGQVLRGLVNPNSLDDQTATVLYSLRLPMAAAAITTGASLWRGVSAETMISTGDRPGFPFSSSARPHPIPRLHRGPQSDRVLVDGVPHSRHMDWQCDPGRYPGAGVTDLCRHLLADDGPRGRTLLPLHHPD